MTLGRIATAAVVAAGLLAVPASASAHDGSCRRDSRYSRGSYYGSSYDRGYYDRAYYDTVYDNGYYAPRPSYYGYGYVSYRNRYSSRYAPYRYDRYGYSRRPAGYYYRRPVRSGLTIHIGW